MVQKNSLDIIEGYPHGEKEAFFNIIKVDGLPGFSRIPKRKINQEF